LRNAKYTFKGRTVPLAHSRRSPPFGARGGTGGTARRRREVPHGFEAEKQYYTPTTGIFFRLHARDAPSDLCKYAFRCIEKYLNVGAPFDGTAPARKTPLGPVAVVCPRKREVSGNF